MGMICRSYNFAINYVPKEGKRSVLAVIVAALDFLFVKNFCHILIIFKSLYANFFISA